ncbi:MAG: hypothetical protein M1838_005768 [Thelocarpon superellum]|nr:MAG: hypothetical protein M1838_005768 [Thelocarpon superellum]
MSFLLTVRGPLATTITVTQTSTGSQQGPDANSNEQSPRIDPMSLQVNQDVFELVHSYARKIRRAYFLNAIHIARVIAAYVNQASLEGSFYVFCEQRWERVNYFLANYVPHIGSVTLHPLNIDYMGNYIWMGTGELRDEPIYPRICPHGRCLSDSATNQTGPPVTTNQTWPPAWASLNFSIIPHNTALFRNITLYEQVKARLNTTLGSTATAELDPMMITGPTLNVTAAVASNLAEPAYSDLGFNITDAADPSINATETADLDAASDVDPDADLYANKTVSNANTTSDSNPSDGFAELGKINTAAKHEVSSP